MLGFKFTSQFKKDFKLCEKRHYDTDLIIDIIVKIICEEPLPERCREHGLSGNHDGFTECHVKGDHSQRKRVLTGHSSLAWHY